MQQQQQQQQQQQNGNAGTGENKPKPQLLTEAESEKEKPVEHKEEVLLMSSTKALSVSESEDLRTLKNLETQKADTEVNVSLLRDKRAKLLEAINFSAALVAPTDATKAKKDKAPNG